MMTKIVASVAAASMAIARNRLWRRCEIVCHRADLSAVHG
jgi:hypothetical protein